jgi:hypothetical protein
MFHLDIIQVFGIYLDSTYQKMDFLLFKREGGVEFVTAVIQLGDKS